MRQPLTTFATDGEGAAGGQPLGLLGWRRTDFRAAALAWIGTACLLATMWILAPAAASWNYVANLLRQASPLGLVAFGQMLTLLVAGIDMSVGSLITLTNILLTGILNSSMDRLAWALAAVYLACFAVGLFNGLTVTYLRVPPIVVTLATGTILQGAYLIMTDGVPGGFVPPAFRVVAEGWIGPLPTAWVIWTAVGGLLWIILYRSPYGRRLYATGANARTAFASGVRVEPVIVSAYVLSSILTVTAGILLTSYVGVASLTIGDSFTLNSLAAVVLGGTLFTGGRGGVIGVAGGALFFFMLESILVNLQVGQGARWVVQGVLLLVMVIVSARRADEGGRG